MSTRNAPASESKSVTQDANGCASYVAPKLKRLGSVRDLTLGGTNGGPEGGRMGRAM
jgi:hypothetical protein